MNLKSILSKKSKENSAKSISGINYSPLIIYLNEILKNYEYYSDTYLSFGISILGEEFYSEYSAKSALKQNLQKPYNEACSYLDISSEKCIAKKAALKYSDIIKEWFDYIQDDLKIYCNLKGREKQFNELNDLITKSYENLLNAFNNEITENQDYYSMYKFSYFLESVKIKECDYRIHNGIEGIFETLFKNRIEYVFENYSNTTEEMQKDISTYTSSFYKTAYKIYMEYLNKIEKNLEKIETDFPKLKNNENIISYLRRISNKKKKYRKEYKNDTDKRNL